MKHAITIALALALARSASAGPCLVHGFDPVILTMDGSIIDQLGGIVVATEPGLRKDAPFVDLSTQPWDLVAGKQRAKATITELAPGLSIYAPPKALQGQTPLDLEDSPGHRAMSVTFRFQATDDMPVNPAPQVVKIEHTRKVPMFRTESTIATLKLTPPGGTIALLVRDPSSKSKLAKSWLPVDERRSKQLEIYFVDRCRAEVPGTLATRAGDTVSLAWVDSTGHVSSWSAPMKVVAK